MMLNCALPRKGSLGRCSGVETSLWWEWDPTKHMDQGTRKQTLPHLFTWLQLGLNLWVPCVYVPCLAPLWDWDLNMWLWVMSYIPHIGDVTQYLSFSDSFHLAWCSQDPCMLPQMEGCPPYLWLYNIPLNEYIHLLYPFIHWQTFKLFPYLGHCEKYDSERGKAHTSLTSCIHPLWINTQK